jgi:hypothetical protein
MVGTLAGGGIYWYRKQRPERREQIKQVAGEIGIRLLEEFGTAANIAHQARVVLRASVVPKPEQRTPVAAILRDVALRTAQATPNATFSLVLAITA